MKRVREGGVTLLEVLLAIAILGILSGGLVTMMTQAHYLVHDSTEILSARLKANEVMESLRTRPFEQLRDYSSLVVSESQPMTLEVVVTDFHAMPELKKIVVKVTWVNRKGHEKKFVLATLRSKFSPQRTYYSSSENTDALPGTMQEGGEGCS